MGRRTPSDLDPNLTDLPPAARWREWMGRVEAVIFASPDPVSREVLASIVGADCNLDLLIQDIRDELRARPYDLVSVAGGFHHRTRPRFAGTITRTLPGRTRPDLSQGEAVVLMAIAYFQPVTRAELGKILGKEVSRDTIASLRAAELIAAGPRSPQPGAPYTYVTTAKFLQRWGFESLRDLPDIEQLENAGLLDKANLSGGSSEDASDLTLGAGVEEVENDD
jgi:segregation and condensation protein B